MAENLGAKFTIDTTNLQAGLRTANALIKESESAFKSAASGMGDWTTKSEGLQAKIDSLNTIIGYQKEKVIALKTQYENLINSGLDPTSEKAIKLRTQINNEETALNKNKEEVNKNTEALKKLGDESDGTGDDLKELKTNTDTATGGFTVMKGALSDLVSSGIKAAITGLKDLAQAAVDAYKEVDKGSDNLISATGATGENAEALTQSYKNVAKTFKGDMSEMGTVMGEVNTRFGFTGDKLEEATKQFLRFSSVTGTDAKTAVQTTARALQAAGMDTSQYSILLDQMTAATQKTGVEVNTLAGGLTTNGATMRSLGFDTTSTIAILGQFDAAGVNTETALAGLKKASQQWTAAGKDSREEFGLAIEKIQAAPTDTEAGKIAMETFGKKAGTELADAVRSGRFEYTEMVNYIGGSKDTVINTYNETQDALDELDISLQSLKVDMSDFVDDLLTEYGPELKEGFGMIADAIKGAIGFIFDFTKALGETLGEIYLWCEKVVRWISNAVDKVLEKINKLSAKAVDKIGGEEMSSDLKAKYEKEYNVKLSDEEWSTMFASALNSGGHFATGGIVKQATNAIIGEDGAEAIVPLERNTEWIDKVAEKFAEKFELKGTSSGQQIVVNQTNNYAQAHTRYELWQSERNTAEAVKLATAR